MTEPNARRPNILLVMTDQHRKGAVGCYPNAAGHPVSTPNLDRLAEQGVVFDTAYTTCPVCSPARASLQTGLYPFAHGMQTNLFTSGCMVHELADGPTLLARRLKTLGYTTAYTGKWHLGYGADARSDPRFVERFEDIEAHLHRVELPAEYQRVTALPSTRGYDLADDFPGHGGGGHAYPQFEKYLADHGLQRTIDPKSPNRGILTSGPETSVEHFLAERAIHHIDTMNRDDTPWFCALNFWGPHDPAWVPEEHFAPYRDRPLAPWPSFDEDTSDKPSIHAVKRSRAPWSKFECHLRYHYAYVSFIDEQIGRVLDHLARTGCADNTVVIFTADHGDSLGIHGGLMDKSFFLYEDTAAIPLIIHDPRAGEARR
ncbi:MAG: sulfatase-like hydrolase/transferase, partial [Planctomycetota bacterium]